MGVKVEIGENERRVINDYSRAHPEAREQKPKNGQAQRPLPPGLQKKVAKGGKLPPGWQKKCSKGEVLQPGVFEHCRPLPEEIIVKLPPPPPRTILVTIDGKVVRLAKATREILVVFDVKF